MKSIFLIACLVISATAAPQQTKTAEKSAKLQFSPADAQVYSTASREQFASAAGQVIPQTVYAAGQVVPQVVYGAENVAPAYYNTAASYLPGVVNSVVGYPAAVGTVQGVYPYSSVGRTTVTSTTQNGLPTGTVYEHSGSSHIGHLATATHVKRPGQLYWNQPAQVPAAVYGTPSVQASWYNNQIQYVNGQPVTFSNGQWYYTNAANGGLAVPVPAHLWPQVSPFQQSTQQNQYSSVYSNLYNRPAVASPLIPSIPQTWANSAGKTTWQQPLAGGQSWGQSTVGVRPSVHSDKWYTKTNTQQVIQPFYGQPQYTQQVAAASQGVKGAALRPEGEAEKADW